MDSFTLFDWYFAACRLQLLLVVILFMSTPLKFTLH